MSDLSPSSRVASPLSHGGIAKLKFARPAAPLAPLAAWPAPSMPEVDPFGGINASHLSTPFPKILVQTGHFTTPLAPRDTVSVYWDSNAELIGITTIQETTSGTVYVQVDGRVIRQHGEGWRTYHYIQRNLAGTATPSNVSTVLVKFRIPGEDDDGNPTLTAPVVTPTVIGAGTPVTVTIDAWQNAFEEDRLILLWGAVSYEVPGPFPVDQPVTFPLSAHVIVEGGSNPAMEVSYVVVDQVGNWSQRSPVTVVHVQADNDLLLAPKVIEAPSGVLDLTKLDGDDVHVQVDTEQAELAIGDTIVLTWKGMTGQGTQLPYTPDAEEVTDDVFIIFTIPHARVAPLGPDGSVSLYYEARTSEGALRSAQRNLTVIGEAVVLEAPSVREARDGALDPESLVDGLAHLDVGPYPLMAIGDQVTYYWTATGHGGATWFKTDSRDVSGNDVIPAPIPLVFTLTRAEIEQIKGYAVSVYYTVKHFATGLTSTSQRLELRIGGVITLPPPLVDHVVNGYLDPSAAPDGTNIRVRTDYSGAVHGDFAHVFWNALESYTNIHAVDPARPEVVSPVAARYITDNAGREVTVSYTINHDGQPTRQGGTTTFVIGTETVLLPAPSVLEAGAGNTLPGNAAKATVRIPVGAALAVNDVVTVHWKGTAGAGTANVAKTVTTQAGSYIDLDILAAAILPNAGKAVSVTYSITRAASGRLDGPSPEYVLNVQSVAPVVVTETFEGVPIHQFNMSTPLNLTYFRLRAVNNVGNIVETGSHYAPIVSGRAVHVSTQNIVEMAFHTPCKTVSMGLQSNYGSDELKIVAYDDSGSVAGGSGWPHNGVAKTVSFSASEGRKLVRITVQGVSPDIPEPWPVFPEQRFDNVSITY
ncbi:hypothetical protein FHW69_002907 [Luteibacter sp. Sphag1AF]|uniref:hypothetical protein n=1 Tax=Luteibacter sp. Sphag1AF TaxID=2587031 RepID=UPI00161AF545|nr:hypothetical protein [Luteibacter sp. Sphag1AF]MBB3228272.1 hypothetical protein [Luteibacter sp. Sphag1AF]